MSTSIVKTSQLVIAKSVQRIFHHRKMMLQYVYWVCCHYLFQIRPGSISCSGVHTHMNRPNSSLHWVLPHWAHFTVLRFILVCALCVSLYIVCMCRIVTWWGGPGGIKAYPSDYLYFLQCFDTVSWVIWPVKNPFPIWPLDTCKPSCTCEHDNYLVPYLALPLGWAACFELLRVMVQENTNIYLCPSSW